jgi:hypothetical protein
MKIHCTEIQQTKSAISSELFALGACPGVLLSEIWSCRSPPIRMSVCPSDLASACKNAVALKNKVEEQSSIWYAQEGLNSIMGFKNT